MENHYRVLGVPIFADLNQIKVASTALMRLIDRDKEGQGLQINGHLVNSLKIQNAFNVLADGYSRARYDVHLFESIFSKMDSMDSDGFEHLSLFNYSENERQYLYAMHALEIGRFRLALRNLKKVMKFEKENTHILRWIAQTYLAFGYHSFAIKAMENALSLEPDNADNYLLLGRILEADGCLRSARRNYRVAYRMNPQRVDIREQYERGSLLFEKLSCCSKNLLTHFIPDPSARSFRYQDGLLTIAMVITAAHCFISRLQPMPISQTFKYTGLW